MASPPQDLRVEFTVNPLGIDNPRPRLSWIITDPRRGIFQRGFRVIVSSSLDKALASVGDVWDSGFVESGEQVVEYGGQPLRSFTKYYWRVKVWLNTGEETPWSDVAWFETAVMNPGEWVARWIRGGQFLRKAFTINDDVEEARLYVTGLGYYEARINGVRVGDRVLDPPWSEYEKTVYYSVYDVTSLLKRGINVIGIILGRGRYGPISPSRAQIPGLKYYDEPKALAMLRIRLRNGSIVTIGTDTSWKCLGREVFYDDIYNGYRIDYRLYPRGWDEASFDDSTWVPCSEAKPPGGVLKSTATIPGVKVKGSLKPREVYSPRPGIYVFDFGQNITGWVRLRVKGIEGIEVRVRHSEVINPDGTLNVENLRGAEATDVYVLSGGIDALEPRFTFHGFRYAEVSGYPGVPSIDDVEAVILQSDLESTGSIACSDKMINDIHRITWWSLRGNILNGVQTDCPQRDERMGWLGDAWLSSDSAVYNFNIIRYYEKFVGDIVDSQKDDGSVPDTVPPYWNTYPADPAWGTALIYIPWLLYLHYGDVKVLRDSYEAMRKWWLYLYQRAQGGVLYFSKYGEWVPPGRVHSIEYCPPEILSTWILYRDALTLAQVARVLGRRDDEALFLKRAEEIKDAFNKAFLAEKGYGYFSRYTAPDGSTRLLGGSQTCNALPLYLDMVPKEQLNNVVQSLVRSVEVDWDRHLNVGIFGAKYVPETLVKYGYGELAYRAITQDTYPGWGYMIKEGATTLWERWEKLMGRGMNSHNHHMFGSIDAWFYRHLAGIQPMEPGYGRILIRPIVVDGLRHCSASVYTIRGLVSVEWSKEGNLFRLNATIPANSRAQIHLPKVSEKVIVREGGIVVWGPGASKVEGIESINEDDKYVIINVSSGKYSFTMEPLR